MRKFDKTGVVTNIGRPVHHRFARSTDNIAFISESFAEDLNVPIPRRSQELGLSYGILHLKLLKNTTWKICIFNKTVPHAKQL